MRFLNFLTGKIHKLIVTLIYGQNLITVRIHSGFANQLFQYAFFFGYEKKVKKKKELLRGGSQV